MLRCVASLIDEAITKSEKEAAHKYPLTEEDQSLINVTLRNQAMQKYDCATTNELEEKRQNCRRNAETIWQMFDNARRRDDYKGAREFGIEAENFEDQAPEIEHALDPEINGEKVLAVLNIVKSKAR